MGMVESAIARPYNGYYRTIERKAAALLQSVATNHGFADGNKRTSVILLDTLLRESDYKLTAVRGDGGVNEALANTVLQIVQREISFDELVVWLKRRIRKA